MTRMKRSRVKPTKKPMNIERREETARRIRTLRGKYKHLDLMKGLVEARAEERQAGT